MAGRGRVLWLGDRDGDYLLTAANVVHPVAVWCGAMGGVDAGRLCVQRS